MVLQESIEKRKLGEREEEEERKERKRKIANMSTRCVAANKYRTIVILILKNLS